MRSCYFLNTSKVQKSVYLNYIVFRVISAKWRPRRSNMFRTAEFIITKRGWAPKGKTVTVYWLLLGRGWHSATLPEAFPKGWDSAWCFSEFSIPWKSSVSRTSSSSYSLSSSSWLCLRVVAFFVHFPAPARSAIFFVQFCYRTFLIFPSKFCHAGGWRYISTLWDCYKISFFIFFQKIFIVLKGAQSTKLSKSPTPFFLTFFGIVRFFQFLSQNCFSFSQFAVIDICFKTAVFSMQLFSNLFLLKHRFKVY